MASLGGAFHMSAHQDVLEAKIPDSEQGREALLKEVKNRAKGAVASKNYKDAELLYTKGLDLAFENSEKAILYANLSLVERNMGYLEKSNDSAQKSVDLDPTYVKAWWRLGQVLSTQKKYKEALDAFEEARKLEPTNKALIKECDKLSKQVEQHQGDDDPMEVEEQPKKTTTTKPVEQPKTTTTTTTTKPKTATKSSSVEKDNSGVFSKSDHIKGYKIVNGKKTSYFHNELSEEDKRLIGDIAPKKLETTTAGAPAPVAAAATDGASAWNKAGTWEEKDVTAWAKDTLKASLLSTEYTLPDSSPDPGAVAKVSSVTKLEGHASFATVRGKKRYIYEFSISINFELELGNGDVCQGKLCFPDVDGTCELGEGYDMIDYSVNAGTPPEAGPLLDRFVKNGGLRDALHTCIDDWVRLFRATY